jgi:hypothetical protein
MSRLDSAIRRLSAQRACLDRAIALIAGRPGIALELGLGNGRTYDHLCEHLQGREIFVFERQVMAHPDCRPDDRHLILGDFHDSLPACRARLAGQACLAHADIGSGEREATLELAAWLGPALTPFLADGAVVVSDQALAAPGLEPLPLPDGVASGRYHMYRYAAGAAP